MGKADHTCRFQVQEWKRLQQELINTPNCGAAPSRVSRSIQEAPCLGNPLECAPPARPGCWPSTELGPCPSPPGASGKNEKETQPHRAGAPCHQRYGSHSLPAALGCWAFDQVIENNTKTMPAFFYLILRELICVSYQFTECQLQTYLSLFGF